MGHRLVTNHFFTSSPKVLLLLNLSFSLWYEFFPNLSFFHVISWDPDSWQVIFSRALREWSPIHYFERYKPPPFINWKNISSLQKFTIILLLTTFSQAFREGSPIHYFERYKLPSFINWKNICSLKKFNNITPHHLKSVQVWMLTR